MKPAPEKFFPGHAVRFFIPNPYPHMADYSCPSVDLAQKGKGDLPRSPARGRAGGLVLLITRETAPAEMVMAYIP